MAKKPASLTSDLLARKGEAGPSIVEPASRATLTPGRQPDLSGVSATEGPSPGLYTSPATGRPEDMHGMDEEERPRPPEPEIIYTPEDEEGGGRTRLIVGAFIGLALLGGVLVALSLNQGDSGVAPVAPEIASAPDSQSAPVTPAPAREEIPVEREVAEAAPATQAPEASIPETAPSAAAEAPVAELPSIEVAPAQITSPAAAPKAEPAPAATTAAAPASGGAYVVQLMALREEAGAKNAWAALQKKHPSILGGQALDIERADLGDKGIFYRVRAAGYATKAAAQSACTSLKSAGQDCIVKTR
ncbi:SPOR domain-containing protein [Parvibaculum sp.]|uniref:SPOR domain-containing protein n=1 Tax=Parvibaculum sp. TaxID=2024848 RepID=UPI003C796F84